MGFTWIGFGPGERRATGTGFLGFVSGSRRVGAIETRVVFGAVGVVLSILTVVAFRSTWRSGRAIRHRSE